MAPYSKHCRRYVSSILERPRARLQVFVAIARIYYYYYYHRERAACVIGILARRTTVWEERVNTPGIESVRIDDFRFENRFPSSDISGDGGTKGPSSTIRYNEIGITTTASVFPRTKMVRKKFVATTKGTGFRYPFFSFFPVTFIYIYIYNR